LDDFMRLFDPELSQKVNLRLTAPEPAVPQTSGAANLPQDQPVQPELQAEGASVGDPLTEPGIQPAADQKPQPVRMPAWLQSWFTASAQTERASGLPRLKTLIRSKPKVVEPQELQPKREKPRWWVGRVVWILGMILFGFLVWRLLHGIAVATGWKGEWDFTIPIWVFIIFGVLDSLKALLHKAEKVAENEWLKPDETGLKDLTGNNRSRTDRLVRQQCSQDLEHTRQMLNDLRSRTYRTGNEDLALRMRELERKFDQAASQLRNPGFGTAPYLDNPNLSRSTWLTMLKVDEQLLVRSAALGDDVHQLQQAFAAEEFNAGVLSQVESCLDAFLHQFSMRSQALRATEIDKNQYRMSESL
jgi:hypothetical protein